MQDTTTLSRVPQRGRRCTWQYALQGLSLALLLAGSGRANAQILDPLIQVSGLSPFANNNADNVPGQSGTNYLHSELEPWVAVNPVNANNIVCAWQQDRWSNGGCRGIVAGVSFDGGQTWQTVPIPGFTLVTGGPFQRASDPWVTFAPNGDCYVAGLGFNDSDARSAIQVNKSTDGGLHWGTAQLLIDENTGALNDKDAITADPTNANYVYAVWDRVGNSGQPTVFTRTTNGGQTWESARYITGDSTIGNQIVVLPNGTLACFFLDLNTGNLSLVRSTDKGQTWTPTNGVIKVAAMLSQGVSDPDTGQGVRDGADIPSVAVDPNNGNLYAVWEDGSTTNYAYDVVLFSQSTNGGLNWSTPVRINKTPSNITNRNRQAWNPAINVAKDGTIAVSYYDFRNNTTAPGALTDAWIVRCKPGPGHPPTNSANWGDERRLTDTSFDIKKAPFAGGYFVGDYEGLAAVNNDFLAIFAQPHGGDPDSIFARRIQLAVTVSGTITLEGCSGMSASSSFEFRPTNGGSSFVVVGTINTDGSFSLPNIPDGNYNVAIKSSKYLQKVVPVDASNGDVSNVNVTLLTGDINDDNFVDIDDLGLLAYAFGTVSGNTRFNAQADLNCDNKIDLDDLVLLANNYGLQGDF